jgi:hypothetical protein
VRTLRQLPPACGGFAEAGATDPLIRRAPSTRERLRNARTRSTG